jgi:hypothetical protein
MIQLMSLMRVYWVLLVLISELFTRSGVLEHPASVYFNGENDFIEIPAEFN